MTAGPPRGQAIQAWQVTGSAPAPVECLDVGVFVGVGVGGRWRGGARVTADANATANADANVPSTEAGA